MSYTDFAFGAAGSNFGVSNFEVMTLPVQGDATPGNLYVRVTGIAQAMTGDPPWGDEPPWMRGILAIATDPIFESDDKLIGACATVSPLHMERDENFLSNDDWGVAVDQVASVQIANNSVYLIAYAAYRGDAVIPHVSFSVDLLVYRPSLVSTSTRRWVVPIRSIRYAIEEVPLVPRKRAPRPRRKAPDKTARERVTRAGGPRSK